MNLQERQTVIKEIKTLISKGDFQGAFDVCEAVLRPEDDFVWQSRCSKIMKEVDPKELGAQSLRIALLGGSTLNHFSDVLRLWLAREGLCAEIYLGEFDAVQQEILDPNSQLYFFKPDVVWFFSSYRDIVLNVEPGASLESVEQAVSGICRSIYQIMGGPAEAFVCICHTETMLTFLQYQYSGIWRAAHTGETLTS